jgi:hypothetical protein
MTYADYFAEEERWLLSGDEEKDYGFFCKMMGRRK